ncbi:MOSC N-terminal beta barrel domain-containing protein [Dactylosporangium cerinum]|uniref:MOSC N-terminal beta barrel domain-containing protein n=1 Tax=Dactylosporangium cerinum TaxID=1434730 RepID=A0ABV9W1N8_9ACTN
MPMPPTWPDAPAAAVPLGPDRRTLGAGRVAAPRAQARSGVPVSHRESVPVSRSRHGCRRARGRHATVHPPAGCRWGRVERRCDGRVSATLHLGVDGKGASDKEVAVQGGVGRRPVGRVVGLWRYPVKSMGAEELREARVSWHGVAGDRRWAFMRDGQVRNGMPWLTISRRPEMVLYRPWFVEPDRPHASCTMVRSPSGEEFEVVDPALARQLGDGLRVVKQDRGVFDAMPLSVITTRSVAGVGALAGAPLDVLRFRPNLLIEADDPTGFPEDAWVGRVLHVGRLRCASTCATSDAPRGMATTCPCRAGFVDYLDITCPEPARRCRRGVPRSPGCRSRTAPASRRARRFP